MTRNQALELVAFLVAHYPAQAKLSEDNVNAYVGNLMGMPHELAGVAIKTVVQVSVHFPAVALIVEAIVERALALPTPEAAWNEVLRRNEKGQWTDMDPVLKQALKSVGGSHAIANNKTYLVRREFIEAYTAERKAAADRMREEQLPAIERRQRELLIAAAKAAE